MRKLFTLVFVTISFQVLFAQKQKPGFNLVVGQTYYLTIKSASTDALQNLNGPKVKISFNSSEVHTCANAGAWFCELSI